MGGITSSSRLLNDYDFDPTLYLDKETDLAEVLNIRQAFLNCTSSRHPYHIKFRMLQEFSFLTSEDLKLLKESVNLSTMQSFEVETAREPSDCLNFTSQA